MVGVTQESDLCVPYGPSSLYSYRTESLNRCRRSPIRDRAPHFHPVIFREPDWTRATQNMPEKACTTSSRLEIRKNSLFSGADMIEDCIKERLRSEHLSRIKNAKKLQNIVQHINTL